ncbi:type II methionyl aminopeptidase [Candidatus Bathyarchaeota archaeon]|nr:type II methionyl aminopeptidase [Candidatus Bathyarchaeota archaeon]
MIDKDVLEKYRQAGKIAAEVREEMRRYVKEGMRIIEICEKAESLIEKKGGKPAFPCNISVNEIAAHYTSPPGDERTIPNGAVVKIDVGVHIDGYIADTATTVSFNPQYRELVKTTEEALNKGIEYVRAGASSSGFGALIQKTIVERGFKPISNLTGHSIGRYLIHSGKSLPNVPHFFGFKFKEGDIFALEPFVTLADAAGKVENGDLVTIFRFHKKRKVKGIHAKKLLVFIERNFRTLPFAERWLIGVVPKQSHNSAFKELLSSKSLVSYPVFIEASRKVVAQAEHTVLVKKNGCEILTEK